MGHKLAKPRYLGDAEAIMIEEKTGIRLGATEFETKRWSGDRVLTEVYNHGAPMKNQWKE